MYRIHPLIFYVQGKSTYLNNLTSLLLSTMLLAGDASLTLRAATCDPDLRRCLFNFTVSGDMWENICKILYNE